MEPRSEPGQAGRRDVAVAIAVGLLYYALTLGTVSLALGPGVMAGVWPQSGLALAATLHAWRRGRPWLVLTLIFAAHAAACLQLGIGPAQAAALGVADVLEPLAAAWILRRWGGGAFRLRGVRDMAALVLLAAGCSNVATAVAGGAAVDLGSATTFADAWLHWSISDGLGMVVCGGLLLSWSDPDPPAPRPRSARDGLELLLSCGLLAALGAIDAATTLAFPLLLWPAMRFGPRGATAALSALALTVIGRAVLEHHDDAHTIAAQSLLCVAAICSLFPAALMVERRRVEDALRRSQEHLERAQQVAHLGLWVRDLERGAGPTADHWTRELYRLLGVAPEVAAGPAPFLERVDPVVGALVVTALREGQDLEDRALLVRGARPLDLRWLLVRTRVERDDAGRARSVVGTFLDVTASRTTQLALEESEQRYRTLFETAPVGLGVADLDGTLLAFNRAMLEPGGYTAEEIHAIGNVAALYVDPEERAAALAQARRDGRLDRLAVRFRRRDGSAYQALLTLRPIVLHGRSGWLAMAEDVTAQRRAEEAERHLEAELQHARKMEAVGVFASGVAHDFNNLLTAIYGYTELAARRAGDDAALVDALRGVREAADQASAVTRSLLAFARRSPPSRVSVDLAAVVRDGARLLRRLVPPAVEIVLDLGAGVWTSADPGQLHQVVVNLVVNASEAMPHGGRVTITVRGRDADEALGGPASVLTIEDTGAGIADEHRQRIFEPFFTTKQRERGTGLAVVHGIVSALGGRILVDSAVGRGTSMSVVLHASPTPPAPAPAPAAEGATLAPGQPRRRVVVVAEDDPLVRRALEEGLRDAALEVRAHADGEAALAATADEPDLALLVLDVDLPGLSGPEVLRAARSRGVLAPALVVTGDVARVTDVVTRDPIARVLEKPFDLRRLREAVEDLLRDTGRA
jgi:PAS domain S-box-containing protein